MNLLLILPSLRCFWMIHPSRDLLKTIDSFCLGCTQALNLMLLMILEGSQ